MYNITFIQNNYYYTCTCTINYYDIIIKTGYLRNIVIKILL